MATHTSGTWAIQYSTNDYEGNLIHAGFRPIAATVTDDPSETTPEDEANANLIAAAPTLLAAAELMLRQLEDMTIEEFSHGLDKTGREALSAAIAKAKGE